MSTASPMAAWDSFLVRGPLPPPTIEFATLRSDEGESLDAGGIIMAAARDDRLLAALTVAAPTVSRALRKALDAGRPPAAAKDARRLALTILRYDIRRRRRPTPFGLFAGIERGTFGDCTRVDSDRPSIQAEPDLGWVRGLVETIQGRTDILPHLRLRRHELAGIRAGRLVLDTPPGQGRPTGSGLRGTVSLPATAAVLRLWEACAGERTCAEVIAEVADGTGASTDTLLKAVGVLVANDLLVTDLHVPLDGSDPMDHLLRTLARCDATSEVAALRTALGDIADACARLDVGSEDLATVRSSLNALMTHDTPLHVDTRLNTRVQIGEKVRQACEDAAEVLVRLTPSATGTVALRSFRQRFLERFGTAQLVPVSDLLDDAVGLGAPEGYQWPVAGAGKGKDGRDGLNRRDVHLAALLSTTLQAGRRELRLTSEDIEALEYRDGTPRGMDLYFGLLAASPEAVDAGAFTLVVSPNPGSPEAGTTAARFAHLWGDGGDLSHQREDHLLQRHPGASLLDIAFAPRAARAANLMNVRGPATMRVAPGLPTGRIPTVSLDDLLVGATGERLYLLDRRTGGEVLPTTTSMVNMESQAPNVARFLWELGFEGQRVWTGWDWGLCSHLPFLPRVSHGENLVLSPATWKVDQIRHVLAGSPAAEHAAIWARWAAEQGVPRHVSLLSSDQRLDVDTEVPWHVALLLDEIGRDPAVVIQESFAAPTDIGWFEVDGVPAPCELVASFGSRLPADAHGAHRTASRLPVTAPQQDDRLVHGLASSWVSLHVGVPRKWHDHVVRVELPRLLAELNGRIDSWFFVRYSEPQGPCLRIRLHTAHDEDWPVTVRASAAWAARLRETGLSAWNAFREYEPEVARYGGLEALPAAEDLFCADSSAVPRLLALRAAHRHLDDVTFGATLISLLTAAFAGGLVPGCDDDPAVVVALLGDIVPRDPLGDDRQHLARFTRLLNPREGWQGLREEVWGQALVQVTEGSRVAMRAWAARLGGLPPEAVAPAFASALHMTCNRLLGPTTEFERRLHLVAHAAAHANAQREVHLMGEQTCRQ